MALTATFMGQATGVNVTALSLTTSGNAPAGGQVFVGVCLNLDGFDDLVDSAGNTYQEVGGSQIDVDSLQMGAFLFRALNNVRLPNNATITVTNTTRGTPFTARIAAFYVSGLTSGQLQGSSGGQGNSTQPLVALDNVPVGNYLIALVCVAAGSTNTFTQDPNFSNPGNFNAQTTSGFSAYAGYRQNPTTGSVLYRPSLALPTWWNAMMVSLAP